MLPIPLGFTKPQSRAVISAPLVLLGCNPGAPSCGPSVWTVPEGPALSRFDIGVMHVVVELEERLVEIRALADLRTDRDQLAARRRDEVPMRRYLGDEQVRRISEPDAGKDGQRDDGANADKRELESSLHFRTPL